MSGLSILIAVGFSVLINLSLKYLFKNLKTHNWVKSLSIFLISLALTTLVSNLIIAETNISLSGASGGIGMIGVGIGAGLGAVLLIILYLLINLVWFVVRLIRKEV